MENESHFGLVAPQFLKSIGNKVLDCYIRSRRVHGALNVTTNKLLFTSAIDDVKLINKIVEFAAK